MKNFILSAIITTISITGFYSCQDSQFEELYTDNTTSVATPPIVPATKDTTVVSIPVVTKDTVVVPPTPTNPKPATPYKISEPIVLRDAKNVTISNLQITNPNGNCITLINCSNITIQDCKLGPSKGEGVSISNSTNITVTYTTMESVRTGVYAGTSSGIKVLYNDVKNVTGPMPRGQMVQFDKVSGAGNRISYNVAENIAGKSTPEDVISLYKSNGTAADPIKVVGNWIRGGGPSNSGGGIMTGDGGGSYILVEDNILVNPGQYGLSISGGHHITIRNNKVFSQQFPFSNVGIFAWNQYSSESHSNTISNNEVNFTNKNGSRNNWWNNGNMGTISGWSTNVYNAQLTANVLPAVIIGKAEKHAIESIK